MGNRLEAHHRGLHTPTMGGRMIIIILDVSMHHHTFRPQTMQHKRCLRGLGVLTEDREHYPPCQTRGFHMVLVEVQIHRLLVGGNHYHRPALGDLQMLLSLPLSLKREKRYHQPLLRLRNHQLLTLHFTHREIHPPSLSYQNLQHLMFTLTGYPACNSLQQLYLLRFPLGLEEARPKQDLPQLHKQPHN